MKVKLDAAFLQAGLRCPEGKGRVEFCCVEFPGLYLEVRATSPGQGTFYYRRKNSDGKTCHKKLGTSRELTVAAARQAARTLRTELALGRDPHAEAAARKSAPTLAEFFEGQALPFLKQHKRSWRRDEMLWRLRIKPRFGQKRLADITRRDLVEFQAALVEQGLAAASNNHHFRLIRHLYTIAMQ